MQHKIAAGNPLTVFAHAICRADDVRVQCVAIRLKHQNVPPQRAAGQQDIASLIGAELKLRARAQIDHTVVIFDLTFKIDLKIDRQQLIVRAAVQQLHMVAVRQLPDHQPANLIYADINGFRADDLPLVAAAGQLQLKRVKKQLLAQTHIAPPRRSDGHRVHVIGQVHFPIERLVGKRQFVLVSHRLCSSHSVI